MSGFKVTHEEFLLDGSFYAHDHQVNSGYANVPLQPCASALTSTVDLGGGIHLDYGPGGLYGIERVGGPVDLTTLMRVIRHLADNGSKEQDR